MAGAGYLILALKWPPTEFKQNDLFLVETAQKPAQQQFRYRPGNW
jgi:hypothetical protein